MKIIFRNIDQVLADIEGIHAMVTDGVAEAVDISLRDVQERARQEHSWISRTGQAEQSIDTASTHGDMKASGTVFTTLPHAIYLHTGTKPHVIVPKRKKALRFVKNGAFIFARRVHHPGTKGDTYIYDAMDAETSAIVARFEALVKNIAGR